MKIAVIGSGIAGVLSAFRLDQAHSVTLFEKRDRLGGHAHTVDVSLDSRTEPVDTGFIVYNEPNYPTFVRFLKELEVPTKPSSMSFSFRSDRTGLEYAGHGLRSFFPNWASLFDLGQWSMMKDLIRFYRSAPRDRGNIGRELTLGSYLKENNYGKPFVKNHLLPMVASIWSVPLKKAREFPFVYVVDFFENHGLLELFDRPRWRTIDGGSREYLRRFRESFDGRIRCDTPIERVDRDTNGVLVYTRSEELHFDAVVLAVHTDQALGLLADPSRTEKNALEAFPYETNQLVLHTDSSILPKDPKLWSSWNYHRFSDEPGAVSLTYDLSILQDLDFDEELCVTLNATEKIDPDTIIDTFEYDHPVYSREALDARDTLKETSGRQNLFYAGAWMGDGFHEDGARSAHRVAEELGVEWE
jgi:predicted NAD/FAD-binding protein